MIVQHKEKVPVDMLNNCVRVKLILTFVDYSFRIKRIFFQMSVLTTDFFFLNSRMHKFDVAIN